MQDSDKSYINLDLLYYYKEMPTCLLINLSIKFNIVNGIRVIVYGIMSNFKGNYKLF